MITDLSPTMYYCIEYSVRTWESTSSQQEQTETLCKFSQASATGRCRRHFASSCNNDAWLQENTSLTGDSKMTCSSIRVLIVFWTAAFNKKKVYMKSHEHKNFTPVHIQLICNSLIWIKSLISVHNALLIYLRDLCRDCSHTGLLRHRYLAERSPLILFSLEVFAVRY